MPCGPFFRFFLVPSSPFIALEHGGWCAFHEARRNPPRMEHLPHTGRKTFDLPTFKWRRNFKIFLRFWNNFFFFFFLEQCYGAATRAYGTMSAAFAGNIGNKSAPVDDLPADDDESIKSREGKIPRIFGGCFESITVSTSQHCRQLHFNQFRRI